MQQQVKFEMNLEKRKIKRQRRSLRGYMNGRKKNRVGKYHLSNMKERRRKIKAYQKLLWVVDLVALGAFSLAGFLADTGLIPRFTVCLALTKM